MLFPGVYQSIEIAFATLVQELLSEKYEERWFLISAKNGVIEPHANY